MSLTAAEMSKLAGVTLDEDDADLLRRAAEEYDRVQGWKWDGTFPPMKAIKRKAKQTEDTIRNLRKRLAETKEGRIMDMRLDIDTDLAIIEGKLDAWQKVLSTERDSQYEGLTQLAQTVKSAWRSRGGEGVGSRIITEKDAPPQYDGPVHRLTRALLISIGRYERYPAAKTLHEYILAAPEMKAQRTPL